MVRCFGGFFEVCMKFPFLKSFCLLFAAICVWNCSDASSPETEEKPTFKVCPEAGVEGAFHLTGGMDIIIYPDMVVTKGDGTLVGTFLITEGTTGSIIGISGKTLIQDIDLATLPREPVNTPAIVITAPSWYVKNANGEFIIRNDELGIVTDVHGNNIGLTDLSTAPVVTLYNGTDGGIMTIVNLDTLDFYNVGDRCTITPEPVESSSSKEHIESSADGNSSSSAKSSGSNTNSSSSAKSSSSSAKSSSSATGGCPAIKTKGGASGSGWATRYWDCCKPHCSWPEHANGNYARQCTNKGKTQDTNYGGNKSICDGQGSAMTCTSQIPFTVDGCSSMGFAFAAVPASNGGACGKCFQLTFTGKGHYSSTNANTKAIEGKKLIIMVTNVGTDVENGQFDIMIPGGGVGIFNGCSSMGWGGQGEQYGGLLSDCEKENNYNAGKYQECLKNKCNSVFSNDSEAKKGCMFLVNYMHAAGNPEHNYVEVECPDVLKNKY